VHLLEATHGILPRDDQEAAQIVRESMLRDGVNIYCCGKNTRVEQGTDGVRLVFESHENGHDIVADKLLVSAGRAPNVEHLNLEEAGVEYTRRGITVDDRLRTTNPRIFAAGDVASPHQFTHVADFMARIVIGNALFFGRAKASALTIPWATYTQPELAHVGRTVDELRKDGMAFVTHRLPLKEVDRAILDGEDDGLVKVHADAKGRILGATIVASHAGDLIGELSLAMTGGLRLGDLAKAIHPYPTQGEALRKVGDAYNRTRLRPWIAAIIRSYLRWRR
jgi:pyruvate/2-oxoglutarate dehydrogenase complex dihydrolipoamide dehydrogenase (E3) component